MHVAIRLVWWPWPRTDPSAPAGGTDRAAERRRWHDRPFDWYGMSLMK